MRPDADADPDAHVDADADAEADAVSSTAGSGTCLPPTCARLDRAQGGPSCHGDRATSAPSKLEGSGSDGGRPQASGPRFMERSAQPDVFPCLDASLTPSQQLEALLAVPPSTASSFPPARRYVEAIRRSAPPAERRISTDEISALPEWRLLNASPVAAAWMAPVSPLVPTEDLPGGLLGSLSALSLDAAFAFDHELRAVAAAEPPPQDPASPPPWAEDPSEGPPPSPKGDLVDSRSTIVIPVHLDVTTGIVCVALVDLLHEGFPGHWPYVHRGVVRLDTREALWAGINQPNGRLCASWSCHSDPALHKASSSILLRAAAPGGDATLLTSYRSVRRPASASVVPQLTPPAGTGALGEALTSFFQGRLGTYGSAQLPSPVLGGGHAEGETCSEMATSRNVATFSEPAMRRRLLAVVASSMELRVRHVGAVEGDDGAVPASAEAAAPYRIAPRPGWAPTPPVATGLVFACGAPGCDYTSARRYNLSVHQRMVSQGRRPRPNR